MSAADLSGARHGAPAMPTASMGPTARRADLGEPLLQARRRDLADLSRAKLDFAVLRDANLSGALLVGADLAGADFSGATLAGADLAQADVSAARFKDAKGLDAAKGWDRVVNADRAFLN